MKNVNRYRRKSIMNPVYVFTDSEWIGAYDPDLADTGAAKAVKNHICTQCLYTVRDEEYRVLAVTPRHFTEELEEAAYRVGFTHVVQVMSRPLMEKGVISVLPGIEGDEDIVPVFYFSPLDLAYLVGVQPFKQMVHKGVVEKKRAHSLTKDKVDLPCGLSICKVIDLFGLNPRGAEEFAKSIGFPTLDKAESKKWDMSHVDIWLRESPQTLAPYLMFDIQWMQAVSLKFPELVNHIRAALGIEKPLEFLTMPHTVGALTAKNFYDWLKTQVPNLKKLQRASGRPKDPSSEGRTDSGYYDTCLDGARVCVLAEKPGTIAYNAVVLGGRAVNERPACYYTQGRVADIDLKSCYGSSLADVQYPIGLPRVYGSASSEGWLTVRQFLDRYEKELVPGLWQMTIEGVIPLNKEAKPSGSGSRRGVNLRSRLGQNLLMGKRVEQKAIDNARMFKWSESDDDSADYDEDDIAKIPGTFALCTNRLEGVVLTHDLLHAVRSVATPKELGDFYKMRVKCAAWYAASDKCETLEDFETKVLNDKGEYAVKDGSTTGEIVDTRTRAWFPVSLKGFSGRLVEMRNEVKGTDKPLSEVLKLFVNSTYGVFASPYFEIGNAIVANNITAKARLGAWMMAMALGSFQSITDGGAYNLDTVRFLDHKPGKGKGASHNKLPGLTVFAELPLGDAGFNRSECQWQQKPSTGRYIGTLPVECDRHPWDGGEPLSKSELDEYCKAINLAAKEHINRFFAPYGLNLPFDIEHKETTFAVRWATYGKTDYALDSVTGKRIYKLRGANDYRVKDGKQGLRVNYRYLWLDAVLEGERPPSVSESDVVKLVSVTAYLKMRGDKQELTYPGCEIRTTSTIHYKPTNVPLPSMDDHEKWGGMSDRELERRAMDEWLTEPEHLARRGYEATLGKHRDTIK